jgi:hypothetical protein
VAEPRPSPQKKGFDGSGSVFWGAVIDPLRRVEWLFTADGIINPVGLEGGLGCPLGVRCIPLTEYSDQPLMSMDFCWN